MQHGRHAYQQPETTNSNPKAQHREAEWGDIFGSFWHHLYSQGWVANAVITVTLGLVFLLVSQVMKNPKTIAIVAIAGLTLLLWTFGFIFYRSISDGSTQKLSIEPAKTIPLSKLLYPTPPITEKSTPSAPESSARKEAGGKRVLEGPKKTTGDKIHIEQHNDAPGSKSYAVGKGNLTVNEAPPSRELSAEQEAKGRDALSATKGIVRIILLGSNNTEAQRFTQQIYRMFDEAHWEIQPLTLGMGPVPPGVHLVGDPENQFVAAAKKAFDSIHLDCIVGPGYAGPLGLGAPPTLTITVGPRPD